MGNAMKLNEKSRRPRVGSVRQRPGRSTHQGNKVSVAHSLAAGTTARAVCQQVGLAACGGRAARAPAGVASALAVDAVLVVGGRALCATLAAVGIRGHQIHLAACKPACGLLGSAKAAKKPNGLLLSGPPNCTQGCCATMQLPLLFMLAPCPPLDCTLSQLPHSSMAPAAFGAAVQRVKGT